MSLIQEAAAALSRAEQELQALLAKAAEHAQYDQVQVLAGIARELRSIKERSAAGARDFATPPSTTPTVSDPQATPDARSRARTSNVGRGQSARRRKGSRRVKRSPEYPRFLREGDSLVKIGWSKKDRATYEHKAPQRILKLVLDRLLHAGRSGRRFTTEDIIPLRDPDSGTDVPTYQVYLAIAWLRTMGLMVQHGRQGYSLPPRCDVPAVTEERWKSLTAR